MRKLMNSLVKDESGAIIAVEYLLYAVIVLIGLVTGLVAARQAVLTEYEELANAILSLNTCFSFNGQSNCASYTCGSNASDSADSIPITGLTAAAVNVDGNPCD